MELRDTLTRLRKHHYASHQWKIFKPAGIFYSCTVRRIEREIAIVDWFCFTALIFLDVITPNDPLASQSR